MHASRQTCNRERERYYPMEGWNLCSIRGPGVAPWGDELCLPFKMCLERRRRITRTRDGAKGEEERTKESRTKINSKAERER